MTGPLVIAGRWSMRRFCLPGAVVFLVSALPSAVQPALAQETTLFARDGFTLRWHLQGGLNAVSESNLFWDLAATTAPASGFDPDTDWLESYLKPGLSFEARLDGGAVLYGGASAVLSHTFGTDAFAAQDSGATTLEEAYLALRGGESEGISYDLSLGPREVSFGTGMLVANGATNGFERGALKFGPRKAWEMAALGKLSHGPVTGSAFYLDPNELPGQDGRNALAGLDLRFDDPKGGYIGATYVDVIRSGSPYPVAAPGGIGAPSILAGGREATRTLNIYAKTNPFDTGLANWVFTGDLALQRNDRIDMEAWAGRVTIGYSFADRPWSPMLTLGYQTFSGDDPDTATLERFDPLYYQGSPSAWATGSKSASTFINSNVNALSLALQLSPSPRESLTLRYAHVRANELKSPIQFGQGTRLDPDFEVVAGVTTADLADDLFLEYSRVINRNTFLTAGVSASFPGAGIDRVIGRDASPWTGGFANVVIAY
ncbi:alginate export protein [Rhodobacter capsulatus]|uniref:alginate export family protein n=2 Tax=Rhodobacter capsulatus TaxID=1061 RepID=UPI000B10C919|nr:alginate export family protein [Rhodobacter capsulatus]PZX22089.1 alginate export protein [Rhodobacter capsulatus]